MTPKQWIDAARLRRAQQLLETTDLTIETIANECGFRSPVTFRQRFHACFGVSPMSWRSAFRDNGEAVATTSVDF